MSADSMPIVKLTGEQKEQRFFPHVGTNRKQRRAHLNSKGIYKPERKNLLIVIGKTKFKNWIQKIRFMNPKTERFETRRINHMVAY